MVTGRLENWEVDLYNGIIWGDCYDDVHNRFRNGTYIHTSTVKNLDSMNLVEGDKVMTLNSTYLLGKSKDDFIDGFIKQLNEESDDANFKVSM